jgi:hypothetical protein
MEAFVFFNYFVHGFNYRAFKKATTKQKVLEIVYNLWAVNVVERIGDFGFSVFIQESEATHGRISERIARIDRAMIKHVKVMRRNNPSGSFAK